jgi:hypothetical protein
MRSIPLLLLVLMAPVAGCLFDPSLPDARVLCTANSECTQGQTCQPIAEPGPALQGLGVCCRRQGCGDNLSEDQLGRLAEAAAKREAGVESPPTDAAATDSVCGNGKLEGDETCDPPSSCPKSCPAVGCTRRKLEGSAAACNARCVDDGMQTACASGDGCCPTACTAANDKECSCTCGNGMVEAACGETCDPLSNCPTACPAMGCQQRHLVNGGTCQAQCVNDELQTACVSGDGCCPPGCSATSDNDCMPRCGNGVREGDEKCDGSDCPTSCPAMGCQRRKLQGSAAQCTAECVNDTAITTCMTGDTCCPSGCSTANDGDCTCRCGNGVTEIACNEKCDGSDCPTSCPAMGCQLRDLKGSATACTAECVNAGMRTTCSSTKDGCCPSACNATNDPDCMPMCGNSVVEAGETCDPPSACSTQSDACVNDDDHIRTRTGSTSTCTFKCTTTARACSPVSDGFCPTGCAPCSDPDCSPGFACVLAAPAGWTGPVELFDGDPNGLVPGCGGAFATQAYQGTRGLSCDAAMCSACSCTAQGVSCVAGGTVVQGASQCLGGGTLVTASPTCSNIPGFTGGVINFPNGPQATGGTCAHPTVTATKPTERWSGLGRACAASGLVQGGCGGGQICAPGPGTGFLPKLCVFAAGDLSCPGAYSTKVVYYGGRNDTRGCTPCDCTGPTGATCTASLCFHGGNDCTNPCLRLTLPTGCKTVIGPPGVTSSSIKLDPVMVFGARCDVVAGSSQPTGGCTPSVPTTVCCMP